MGDFYVQTSQNWNANNAFYDAASGGTGYGAVKPGNGDNVYICDDAILTFNVGGTFPAIGSFAQIEAYDGVKKNGKVVLSDGVTVSFDSMNARFCGSHGFFRFNGTAGQSCTLIGFVKGGDAKTSYGVRNNSTGKVNIINPGSVAVEGGTGDISYGAFNLSTGTIEVTGNVKGGAGDFSHGIENETSGKVIVNGNIIGGNNVLAFGCFSYNTASGGRFYINGDLIAGDAGGTPTAAFSQRNANISYHYLGYGKTVGANAVASIGGAIGKDYVITAEIDSAADLAAINNLVGDANVSFVQTGDFEVTTPPNIGNVTAFLGSYTGYDAVAQRKHTITFDADPEIDFAIFRQNGGTINKCTIVLDELVAVGAITASGFVGTNSGTLENCVVSGVLSEDGAVSYAGLVTLNTGVLRKCYCTVPFVPLLNSNSGGTVTDCYHLAATGQGITQLTTTQMQGRGMNLDYINVWQEDISGRENNWLPYIRNGRYIKRRREPVGAF